MARAVMASWWRTWTGEVAGVKQGTNRRLALGNLTDDHLYFMYQLHERTPEDKELAKIAANAEAQARIMEQALSKQAETLAAAVRGGGASDAILAAQGERMRLLEEQIASLVKARTETEPETEPEPAE